MKTLQLNCDKCGKDIPNGSSYQDVSIHKSTNNTSAIPGLNFQFQYTDGICFNPPLVKHYCIECYSKIIW